MKKIIRTTILLILIICTLIILFKVLNIEKTIVKILYPIKYEEYVHKYSEELNMDPFLTFSIIKTESNFDEAAKSKSGAIGLMQLMEKTAKEQAQKLDIQYSKEILYNPEQNLRLGLNYFNTLLDYFKDDFLFATYSLTRILSTSLPASNASRTALTPKIISFVLTILSFLIYFFERSIRAFSNAASLNTSPLII